MLKPELKQAGVRMGRDRTFEELRKRDLLLEPVPAPYPHTTQSYHNLPVFGNRIKDKELEGPNEVWVSDLRWECLRMRNMPRTNKPTFDSTESALFMSRIEWGTAEVLPPKMALNNMNDEPRKPTPAIVRITLPKVVVPPRRDVGGAAEVCDGLSMRA